jgi:hypothetical protein
MIRRETKDKRHRRFLKINHIYSTSVYLFETDLLQIEQQSWWLFEGLHRTKQTDLQSVPTLNKSQNWCNLVINKSC